MLKQIHHKGKVESVQSILIKSPFTVGLPLKKIKLHCQNIHVVASHNSSSVSLISTGDENWSLGKLFLLTLSQASLASVNILHGCHLSEGSQAEESR